MLTIMIFSIKIKQITVYILNLYIRMALFIVLGIYLLTINQSKVITVTNERDINNDCDCCIHGQCICGSFSYALQYLDNNTVINVTSKDVPLHGYVRIANLTNITISGNEASVMCNNSGIVTILYCSNVVVKGITWDQCGNAYHPIYRHGIGFRDVSNVIIFSNTFQYSVVCTVLSLNMKSGYL